MTGNGSLGCFKAILHRNSISKRIQNAFSEKSKKVDFSILKKKVSYIYGRNRYLRPNIGQIILWTPPGNHKLFLIKNVVDISYSFLRNPKICVLTPRAQKRRFWLSVVFVAFVAFLGTTMLFFEKFKVKAFRKVYGLWGYFQPLKSYITLKFRWGTVTHLWTGVSYPESDPRNDKV